MDSRLCRSLEKGRRIDMKEELINDILQRMLSSLDNMQMRHLEQVLKQSFLYYDVIDTEKNVKKMILTIL